MTWAQFEERSTDDTVTLMVPLAAVLAAVLTPEQAQLALDREISLFEDEKNGVKIMRIFLKKRSHYAPGRAPNEWVEKEAEPSPRCATKEELQELSRQVDELRQPSRYAF